MTDLKLLGSYAEEDALLTAYIRELLDERSELQILEAGCGPGWPLKLDGIRYRLVGVDLDREALERRIHVAKDLDEAILADLRSLDLGPRKFDVIYNAFVLEHIENAALVLENFARWLRPGGLLLLKLPDRNTVFGFLTNATPFWFHVLYHRYVLGRRNAGRPGYGPYPTYYDSVVSRPGIRKFCESHDFAIAEERGLCTYGVERHLRAKLIRLVAMSFGALSLGVLPWRHNNLTYVLMKRPAANSRQ
jgi:SAM-dependent methyltransferase